MLVKKNSTNPLLDGNKAHNNINLCNVKSIVMDIELRCPEVYFCVGNIHLFLIKLMESTRLYR